ncbi:LexA family transcriptional regulator [Duganella phyllosphaerae]|uniref:Helix-turn-helix protein n=1 Tax=Duganella phyllosphaerae TaxID=762836 RepID=A0A1E7W4L3_9BURK|nr:LexA family transcriptional regulator [Duganella phyllosphaerae]OEZ90700.1 helix-turn-helix protein [Duganella phyllosphaerae]
MDIKNALTQLLASKPGTNMSDLARACEVTPQAVQQWLAGTTTPRGSRLNSVAKYFGMSPLEFTMYTANDGDLEGLSEVLSNIKPVVESTRQAEIARRNRAHPSPTTITTSKPKKRFDTLVTLDAWALNGPMPISSMKLPESEAYAMLGVRDFGQVGFTFVADDAMEPTLQHGDLLFLDEWLGSDKHVAEDGIYLIEFEGKCQIRRLQDLGYKIAIKSDNPLYETWFIDDANDSKFRVLARVIRSMSMKMKTLG